MSKNSKVYRWSLDKNPLKQKINIHHKHSFYKNYGVSLDSAVAETIVNNEFSKHFNNFNITTTKQDIDEFVAIVDQCSRVVQEKI